MSSPIQHQSGPDEDVAAILATAPAYPQLRLNSEALDTNIEVMAAWCRHHGVDLAPHVKTTMSAPIIARQWLPAPSESPSPPWTRLLRYWTGATGTSLLPTRWSTGTA